jgi:hypothetical protein
MEGSWLCRSGATLRRRGSDRVERNRLVKEIFMELSRSVVL